ncbi:hypothetical protein [Jatrophihabitans endophyticus]|uniref:hypothetical protein n=1 Tax=Jatrophihabitans endophyticus TaxID=1206085 RepID=UPI001A0FFC10|nr:hypothetical protein [Jatrophihabitans endophyticus]MBE7187641.1 hypothetical protein [Jatrophihabitans endophyticus]
MTIWDAGRPTRAVAALAVAAAACVGVAGCAAVPDSNATPGVNAGQINAAVARSSSTAPIATWYREVGPRISAVERSVADAQHAVRRPGHRGLHAACRTLRTRAQRVRSARPAPDRLARRYVSKEMAAITTAADHCIDNELLAAGHATNRAQHWSTLADARILHVFRHSS